MLWEEVIGGPTQWDISSELTLIHGEYHLSTVPRLRATRIGDPCTFVITPGHQLVSDLSYSNKPQRGDLVYQVGGDTVSSQVVLHCDSDNLWPSSFILDGPRSVVWSQFQRSKTIQSRTGGSDGEWPKVRYFVRCHTDVSDAHISFICVFHMY